MVAIVGATTCYLWCGSFHQSWILWPLLGIVALILFIACRNELKVFNERAEAITNQTGERNERLAKQKREEEGGEEEGNEEDGGEEDG